MFFINFSRGFSFNVTQARASISLIVFDSFFPTFQRFMKMKVKTLYCKNVNREYIPKLLCKLRPTREGVTLFTLKVFNVSKMDDIWVHTIISVKFGTHFQPTGLEVKQDLCKMLHQGSTSTDIFSSLVYAQVKKIFPQNLIHPCPYEGTFGIEDFNVGEIFERAIPQVIPKATYKVYFRLYRNDNNRTYVDGTSTSELSAVDYMQNFEVGR